MDCQPVLLLLYMHWLLAPAGPDDTTQIKVGKMIDVNCMHLFQA